MSTHIVFQGVKTMARVRGATRGEILRASQKDASFLEELEGKVIDCSWQKNGKMA